MCGIAGIWSKRGKPIEPELVKAMLEKLKHRGPDAGGIWQSPGLILGHTRLKVIDLSDSANQPFSDGRDVLVFNGEIFNYLELRKELSDKYHFTTRSDTEVLFRALQYWGEEAVTKLDGQFAFAFYNANNGTLLLVRDHVGICPLYVMEDDDVLFFASEIKPLLVARNASLDYQGMIDYFFFRYNIQNGRTLFNEIKRFQPAHFRKISVKDGRIEDKRYWRLSFKEQPLEGVQEEFNQLLDSEIRLQQVGDVPLGMYLSGGIDSGALISGYAKNTSDVRTFTLKLSPDDSDYSRVAQLEKRFRFHKSLIQFEPGNLSTYLEDAVFSLEEPFGDTIIAANYLLAQNASQSVKVVLSGEGGDEVFCGYDHQRAFLKLCQIGSNSLTRNAAGFLMKMLPASFLGSINSYPGRFGVTEKNKIADVVDSLGNPAEAYLKLVSLFTGQELKKLFSYKLSSQLKIKPDTSPFTEIFSLNENICFSVMRSEIEQLTLIINLLKQDRFGMRFSLESRVPLVSKNIIEFISRLPRQEIMTKVNKQMLLNYSGSSVIKKKPFSMLTSDSCLREMEKLLDKYVNRETVLETGFLSWDYLKTLRLKLKTGSIIPVKQLMAVLIFMVWFKKFRGNLRW